MTLPGNLKGVLFDFDGTLFSLNVDWIQLKHELATIAELTGTPRRVSETLALASPAQKARMIDAIDRAELQGVITGHPINGAADVLQMLHVRGIAVAIVSRNGRPAIEAGCRAGGIALPNVIIARDDVDRHKPDPEGLLLALNRLGVEPGAAVMVGDSVHDVDAAHAIGVPAILFRNPEIPRQPLTKAELVVDDYAQLAEALLPQTTGSGLDRERVG
ncbi:HAD family hydrolase [Candidatus Berkelbacteria bacterium]|nr:HAD family hydrolase [Candidatus Berkelbacteria bacterium]